MQHRVDDTHVVGFILLFVSALTLSIFQALTKMKLTEVYPSAQSFWNAVTGTAASVMLMACAEEPILPGRLQCPTYTW